MSRGSGQSYQTLNARGKILRQGVDILPEGGAIAIEPETLLSGVKQPCVQSESRTGCAPGEGS